MKKSILAASLLAGLVVAAPAAASQSDVARDAAFRACVAEREADPDAFRGGYGTEHPMRRCIRALLPEASQALRNCKGEREADPEAFRETYANRSGRNALGRCVYQAIKPETA